MIFVQAAEHSLTEHRDRVEARAGSGLVSPAPRGLCPLHLNYMILAKAIHSGSWVSRPSACHNVVTPHTAVGRSEGNP
ncbi:Uncharacterised protein [Mycobacteroides abscessus subsp. abscessus]|nr:Uncharacterised protein [Mycobacteroides abscessus subsp. abscessus]